MKKGVFWLILIIAVIALAALGWRMLDSTQNTTSTPGGNNGTAYNFKKTGNVVRNNPGLKPNIWYLVYEEPGAPAKTAEMVFSNESKCFFGEMELDCLKLWLNNGSRAEAEGNLENNVLAVARLTADPSFYINVNTPKSGDQVTSPLRVSGEARGYWYFEASFPVSLITKSGQTITSTFMEAKSDWMTEEFVPFDKNIVFNVSTTTEAFLVLHNDNASGLPEFDKEIRIPLVLRPGSAQTRTVGLFYYDPNKDKDQSGNIMCSRQGLVRVERTITSTPTVLKDSVELLLKGSLSPAERAAGVTTEFPLQGVKLTNAVINNGIATLTFDDPNNRTGGGSCRVSILWAQIEATAKQFSNVTQVRFIPEELFQP